MTFVPTIRLAVLAAIASLAMLGLSSWSGFLLVNGAILLVALVDLTLAVDPTKVLIERDFPEVVALDTVGELVWTVTNPTSRAITVTFADELARTLDRRGRLYLGHPERRPAMGSQRARRARRHPGGGADARPRLRRPGRARQRPQPL